MAKKSPIDEFVKEFGLKTETQSQSKSQIHRRRRNKVNRVETNNGANLGFEAKLWEAANKLRGHLDAAEYKHVVLGLIFLKYLSDAFQEVYEELKKNPTLILRIETNILPETSSMSRKRPGGHTFEKEPSNLKLEESLTTP